MPNPFFSVEAKGFPEALKGLQNAQKQATFALVIAANETAKEVQAFTVNELLPDKFTLRAKGTPWQKPGNKLGFNIKFANKSNLTSVLGSQANFLERQEEGGNKDGNGHRVAVPTPFWKKREEIMHRTKKPRAILEDDARLDAGLNKLADRVSKLGDRYAKSSRRIDQMRAREAMARAAGRKGAAKKYRAMRHKAEAGLARIDAARNRAATQLASEKKAFGDALGSLKNKPFEARLKSGKEGIFIRTGDGRRMRMLFALVSSVKVSAILTFNKSGKAVVERVWKGKFNDAFRRAVLTAKGR